MNLGVHVGYWGLGLTSEDQIAIVQEAERLGYDSVWTAEAYGPDAATILGWDAAQSGDDRDDRRDPRPALRRAHAPGHRLERAAGERGLARGAVRQAAAAHT